MTDLDLLLQNTVNVEKLDDLKSKLDSGKPLRIKAGFDPTAPDLHLGHMVLLNKFLQFQQQGHTIVFVVGNFTALIGDPSGRDKTRPALEEQEIQKNAETYLKQIGLVLDTEKVEVRFNADWLNKLSSHEMIKLCSNFNVARMLERDDFSKRHKQGQSIAIHEFMYPIMQGYDSVAVKADVELGGTDQLFNLLVGREMQRLFKQPQQIVLTMPIIEGTDGVKKMSKSAQNYIALTDSAEDIFGKIMSISDDQMWSFAQLLLLWSKHTLLQMKNEVQAKTQHPMQVKLKIAQDITAMLTNQEVATSEFNKFQNRFSQGKLPDEITEYNLGNSPVLLTDAMQKIAHTKSKSEARRLITQKAVSLDKTKVFDIELELESGKYLLQTGKRRIAWIIVN